MAVSVLTLVSVTAGAPPGSSDVDDTVRTLEAGGYDVIVNRSGATPLAGCTVTAVRPEPMVTPQTVHVDVAC
jgi:hypothetical protein